MTIKQRTFEMGLHMAFIAMVMQLVFAIGHSVQASGAGPTEHSSDLLSALSFICTGDQIEKRDGSGSDLGTPDCPACIFASSAFIPESPTESWVVRNVSWRVDTDQLRSLVPYESAKTFRQRAPPHLT